MANTLYAAFTDAALAEKAAGALLDHGVRAEDLSLVQHESRYNLPNTVSEDTGISPGAEGELTGATVDSPGIMGTGAYVPNATNDVYSNQDDVEPGYVETTYSGDDTMNQPRSTDAGAGLYNQENFESSTTTSTGTRSGGTGETMGFTTGSTEYVETGYTTGGPMGNVSNYSRDTSEGSVYSDNDRVTESENDKSPAEVENAAKHGISTTTAADAGAGAITGTAVGLGVGAVAALASLLVPGFGLIVGGGALATALGGLAATTGAGAAVGAITGYLKDQGVEEHVAQRYGETVSGGGAVLAIHVPSGDVDEPKARQVLEKYGATNVNTYALTENTRPYMA